MKPADRSRRAHWRVAAGEALALPAVRNGWLSLRLVLEGRGEFAVRCDWPQPTVSADLFREFYHRMADRAEWFADGLVPLPPGAALTIPDPDNRAPDQRAQSVWVDVFVSREARVGRHEGRLTCTAGGRDFAISIALDVLPLVYPDDDAIDIDHNSFGSTFLEKQYPGTVPATKGPAQTDALLRLIHRYHALIFEHHGIYHQLGYDHTGATTELFAPRLSGDGRNRHACDWSVYDRHYGPLFDGSAFRGGRRAPRPLYTTYAPINPNWPADYLGWGQPGFRAELINVLRDFDAHLRDNGWTHTILEYFFNHKKRVRYFEWDGDEPRFARDDIYFKTWRGFLDKAVGGSPVPWKMRCDSDWMMNEHFTSMAGVIDFWVLSWIIDSFGPEVHAGPMARGDICWTYSPIPGIEAPSSWINQRVWLTWARDFTGHVHWHTANPGDDPFFASNGAATAMMYSGERFDVAGPMPTARLKVQRNAVQDINLLEMAARARGKDAVLADLVPGIPIELWREQAPVQRTRPPWEWGMTNLRERVEPSNRPTEPLDPLWWEPVRDYARTRALEVSHG
jgi:hypothetical protein